MSNKDKVSKEHRRNGKEKNVSKYHLKKNEDLEYNLDTLSQIYTEIEELSKEKTITFNDILVEDIKILTDMFIWGDKHDDNFFDFMCETNYLEHLSEIAQHRQEREVRIGIIQGLCLLVLNVKKPMQSNYILSHPIINDFVSFRFDFLDDEFVDYYINFLKSLSQRLDQIPLQLLFNSKYSTFPLLWQTIRFYNHKDAMIRTSVQNIVLGVMKIKAESLEKYLESFPFCTFYVNLSCFIGQQWLQIDQQIDQTDYSNYQRLSDLMNDQIDQIMFLEDLIHSCNEKAMKMVVNSFLSYAIIPYIFGSFTFVKRVILIRIFPKLPLIFIMDQQSDCSIFTFEKGKLSIYLAMHMLTIILQNLSNKEILETIILTLFGDRLNRKHLEWIAHPAQEPAHFNQTWNYRHFWDDYEGFVKKQSESIFDEQIKRNQQIQSNSSHGQEEPKKLDGSGENSTYAKEKCQSEIRRLTRALGIRLVGEEPNQNQNKEDNNSESDYLGESPFDIYYSTLRDLGINKSEELNSAQEEEIKQNASHNYDLNPFKGQITSFLSSKDDNLIMLTLQFLSSIVQNRFISDKVLEYCGLLTQRKNKLAYKNQKNLESIKSYQSSFLKILQIDPPFRLNNYFILSKLIYEFASQPHSSDILLTNEEVLLFNDAYRLQINKVTQLIKTQVVWDFIVDLYESEFAFVEQNLLKPTKPLDYYCFLSLDNCPNSVDLIFKQPVTKRDITRRDLLLFFLVRKLRYTLITQTTLTEQESDLEAAYKGFLGNSLTFWEEGHTYEMGNLDKKIDKKDDFIKNLSEEQRKMVNCDLIEKEKRDSKLPMYFVQDQQNLILIEFTLENAGYIKVLKNVHLKCVEVEIDRADPRKLEVVIKKFIQNGNERYDDFVLIFEHPDFCVQTKKVINENRKTSKQIEITVLIKYLEHSEKDIYIPSIF